MSYAAERWARAQRVGNARAKQVLVELANCHNGKTGKCTPGIKYLHEVTELKEDTISTATNFLQSKGFIKKTYVAVEKGRAISYELLGFNPQEWEREKTEDSTENGLTQNRGNPESVGPPETGATDSPENGGTGTPEFGGETGNKNRERNREVMCASASQTLPADLPDVPFDEAQLVASGNLESFENEVNAEVVFSPDAQIPIENIEILNATASDSIFGTDTPPKDHNAAERKSEAISKPKRKRVSSSVVKDKPEDISQEVWDDWLTTRRAKRLPLTQTALNSVRREAASAGLTFQAAVTFAVEQGWAAFRAEWYRNATRKGDSTKTNARYLTAQERYEERMRKAGEMSDEEYFAQFDLPEEILNYEKAQEAKRHVAS